MVLKEYIKKYGDGGEYSPEGRRKQAYDFFVSKGYTPEQSLGIIGNLMQESYADLRTKVKGDNDASYGIAQWRDSRLKDLKRVRKDDWDTLDGQLEFIHWELNNTESRAYSKLKEARTPEEAALLFSKWYERPSLDPKINNNVGRANNANKVGQEVGYFKQDNEAPIAMPEAETAIDNTRVAVQKPKQRVKPPKLATPGYVPPTEESYGVFNTSYDVPTLSRSEVLQFDKIQAIDEKRKFDEQQLLKQYEVANFNTTQKVEQEQDMLFGEFNQGFDPYNYIELTPYQKGGKMAPEGINRTSSVQLEDFEEGMTSTVLMSSYGDYIHPNANGKYSAFPRLFPKDVNNQTSNINDWIRAENDDDAYELAYKRGEVLYFDTPEEAKAVAEGSWKQKFQLGGTRRDERYDSLIQKDGTFTNMPLLKNLPFNKEDSRFISEDNIVVENLPEVVLNYSKSEAQDKKRKIIEDQYKNLSRGQVASLQKELVESGDLKIKEAVPKTFSGVKDLQAMLIKEGYDLGEYGENKDGVDGKFGEKTKKALSTYNKNLTTIDGILGPVTAQALKGHTSKAEINDRFFDFKEDTDIVGYQRNLEDQGYFKGVDVEHAVEEDLVVRGTGKYDFSEIEGNKCDDSRCTAFVGDEMEKVVGEGGRVRAGAYGDAWTISDNLINSGGSEVYSVFEDNKPKLAESEIEEYMKSRVKSNSSKLKKDMFIEGDVVNLFYEGSSYKGQAYRQGSDKYFTTHTGIVKKNKEGDLVIEHNVHGKVGKENIQKMIGNKVKHSGKDISITAIIRPNYTDTFFDSSNAQVNKENVKDFGDIGSKNAALFTQTIIKNKDAILDDIPINNEEFSNITRALKTIGWRETDFKNFNVVQSIKNVGANVREFFGGEERSRGVTRMKDEKNLTPRLRKKYIRDKGANLHNPVESAIPSFYALSSRYLYLRDLNKLNNLDFSKDELTQMAMLGWNEKINIVGESMKKYRTFKDTMKAYNTDRKTNKESIHPYHLAFVGYNKYLQ